MIVDFKYVQREQKSFIEYLESRKGIKYPKDIFNVPMWVVLALQSELGEILNASKIYKVWDNQDTDKDYILEKCVGFLAHLGDLANILEIEMVIDIDEINPIDLESQFNYLAYRITTLAWKKMFARNKLLNDILPAFVKLVYAFGLTLEDLEKVYFIKMSENYLRY